MLFFKLILIRLIALLSQHWSCYFFKFSVIWFPPNVWRYFHYFYHISASMLFHHICFPLHTYLVMFTSLYASWQFFHASRINPSKFIMLLHYAYQLISSTFPLISTTRIALCSLYLSRYSPPSHLSRYSFHTYLVISSVLITVFLSQA